MFARTLTAIGLALILAHNPAAAQIRDEGAGRENANHSCMAVNDYAPTRLVGTVEDGLGDWLVWVEDKDGDLWMCNANSDGAVYANVLMEGDLLKGTGAELIGYQATGDRGRTRGFDPVSAAETLCSTIGNYIEEMQIVATVEDGLGDYLVWLQNGEEGLWMCNASSAAELYSFEPVDMPINDVPQSELRYAAWQATSGGA
jgi:hypothetical protein